MTTQKSADPQTIGQILLKFNPLEDKYISREFQSFGVYLAEELGDYTHKSLYIRLAKTVPRVFLEKALSFVKDAKAVSKPKLFMWKMGRLKKGDDT
jgi:hypothetical protein